MSAPSLRIGLAGLGVVGATLAKRLLSGAVSGAVLTAVSARDANRDRGIDLSGLEFVADATTLAQSDNVDVVVELIGGSNGAALDLVRAAVAAGKPVITANKAMLAEHADELSLATTPISYEAAIAGGIPIVKTLREGLVGNNILALGGILNGTCNYILTRMEEAGLSFDDALAEAQAAGFAEADPTLDISGADAAQKLILLGALAFDVRPDINKWSVLGIEHITARDIALAQEFSYVIRLVAIASCRDNQIYMQVAPMLVRQGSALAQIKRETNAVFIEAEPVGRLILQGAGAGGGATASAVLADIADMVAGRGRSLFAHPTKDMRESPADGVMSAPDRMWYLRLMLTNKAGSIAQITQILAENGVSVKEVVQRSQHGDDNRLPIGFITDKASAQAIMQVGAALQARDDICSDIVHLPLYDDD